MTCPHCEPWAARTLEQAKNRTAHLALGGDIFACPMCGTRDWATTIMTSIKDRPAETRRGRWIGGALYAALIILCGLIVWYFSKGLING